jgi:hypothetical protein
VPEERADQQRADGIFAPAHRPGGRGQPRGGESFDDAGRLCFHRGTPLRYARAPLRSAFLHPDFCFAPAAFFQEMTEEDGPRFRRLSGGNGTCSRSIGR